MPRYRATFPRMGSGGIAIKAALTELGFDVVTPPPTTRATLTLGARYTPEFACLPLKSTLGNYLEALDLGVDLIFMAGGVGPCRFGLYGQVQREILRGLGHDVPFIIIEPPRNGLAGFFALFTRFLGPAFYRRLPGALLLGWEKARAVDRVERSVLALAPALAPDWRQRLWRQRRNLLELIDSAASLAAIHKALRALREFLAAAPREDKITRSKVMVVGELLVVLEPALNFHLEERLCLAGVEVRRTIFFADWIRDNIFFSLLGLDWQRRLRAEAAPYLTRFVGGHGLESVAHTLEAARQGYAGVVHLAPLGCMPEVIALDLLRRIGAKHNLPVLSLLLDEHTAETGALTRIEAFLDLVGGSRHTADISHLFHKVDGHAAAKIPGY